MSMSSKTQQKCSVCGQMVKTAFGAIQMRKAPIVCRKCFGETTYNVVPVWTQNFGLPDSAGGDN
jgi:ribosomal protein L37E